ncbi:MAG: S8 family serine peptidase [Acidobacteria bacterium]|nr:S8 family serine peptidase [Acidobacteriota bacterium]
MQKLTRATVHLLAALVMAPAHPAFAAEVDPGIPPLEPQYVSLPTEIIPQTVPYGLEQIGAVALWRFTRGGTARVGVIDSGMDLSHPDLPTNYRGGVNFINSAEPPKDQIGHGTHVTGIIAARNDANGIVGVAPDADVYMLRVLDGIGRLYNRAFQNALDWAVANSLDVVNISLSVEDIPANREAIDRALDAGVTIIAASGNDFPNSQELGYPASHPGVVSVGSVDRDGIVSPFSQRGVTLDFVAPGVEIESSDWYEVRGVTTADGTSYDAKVMGYAPDPDLRGRIVACGLGFPEDFPAEVEGAIALIERGELTFAEKERNAAAAGAVAVIVFNLYEDDEEGGGAFEGSLRDPGDWLPVVGVARSTGHLLEAIEGELVWLGPEEFSVWGTRTGTSMAAPWVTGAVALLRAFSPESTGDEIVAALRSTAHDLGDPGPDPVYGFGLIDVEAAARYLEPEKFSSHRRVAGVRRR